MKEHYTLVLAIYGIIASLAVGRLAALSIGDVDSLTFDTVVLALIANTAILALGFSVAKFVKAIKDSQ